MLKPPQLDEMDAEALESLKDHPGWVLVLARTQRTQAMEIERLLSLSELSQIRHRQGLIEGVRLVAALPAMMVGEIRKK